MKYCVTGEALPDLFCVVDTLHFYYLKVVKPLVTTCMDVTRAVPKLM